MIIRVFCVLFNIVFFYIMQTSVFTSFPLAGVVPDLLIVLVCSVAYMRGRTPGMLTGLCSGLLIDFCYKDFLGLFALMYLIIGYLVGFAHKIYDEEDYTLPLILISVSEIVYNFLYYLFFFVLQGKLNIGYCVYRFMIPRVIYTVLVSIVLYKLLNMLNLFLRRFDKEDLI